MKHMKRQAGRLVAMTGIAALAGSLWITTPAVGAVTGAVFTTDSTCTGVNLNIYGSKDDVYLDGGPAHPGMVDRHALHATAIEVPPLGDHPGGRWDSSVPAALLALG